MRQKYNSNSVLDNKETLLHFSGKNHDENSSKNDWYKRHSRNQNLSLAFKLESLNLSEKPNCDKTVRNLKWCNSLAMLETINQESITIKTTSKSCKNPFCHICNRRKSAKHTNRLVSALKDPDNTKKFESKYWYFITLTLKHNQETRNQNYLQELRNYLNRLYRTKFWKTKICDHKSNPETGYITSIECTIGNNGYHIHSHIMVCTNRIKDKIVNIESELRNQWFKITGDSDQVKLDLIKQKKTQTETNNPEDPNQHIIDATQELMKYSLKTGDYYKLSDEHTELLANWIEDTKGKNFINAFGILRKLQITARKCKYDTVGEAYIPDSSERQFVDRLSKLKIESKIKEATNEIEKKRAINESYISQLSEDSQEVTQIAMDIQDWLEVTHNDIDLEYALPEIIMILSEKSKKQLDDIFDVLSSSDIAAKAAQRMNLASQLSFDFMTDTRQAGAVMYTD